MDLAVIKRLRRRFQELETRASGLEEETWELRIALEELRTELRAALKGEAEQPEGPPDPRFAKPS